MVVHICNSTTWRLEDLESKTSVGYRVKDLVSKEKGPNKLTKKRL
jgi:hypothetical protein